MVGSTPRTLRLVVAFGLGSAVASAQEPEPPLALSLDEAISLALSRDELVEAAEAGVDAARGRVRQAWSGYFPQVFGTLSYQHTFVSEFDRVFGDGGPQGGPQGDGGQQVEGEGPPEEGEGGEEGGGGGFADLPFGRDDTWRAGLTLTQNVWAGGANRAQVELARAQERSARITVETTRASVVLSTVQAYLDALLADRLLAVAVAGRDQARRALDETALRFEVGDVAEVEVVRARVALSQQEVEVVRQRHARIRAGLVLRQLLDLPPDREVVLTSALPAVAPGVPPDAWGAPVPPPDRTQAGVRDAFETVRQAEAAVKAARAQGLPSVSVMVDAYVVQYPPDPLPRFGRDDWRPNLSASAQLQVPIFQGLRVRGAIASARAELAAARARHDLAAEQAAIEAADALAALEAARATFDATRVAAEDARRALEIAELSFDEGTLAANDLADARTRWQAAEAELARSAREVVLAELRVLLQPSLPLQGLGAPGVSVTTTAPTAAVTSTTPTATTTTVGTGGMSGLGSGGASGFGGAPGQGAGGATGGPR